MPSIRRKLVFGFPFRPGHARGGTAADVATGERIGFFLLHCLPFNFARVLTVKIRRSILRFLYTPSLYDPAEERAYADHVLRTQMDEWTQEEEQAADHEAFHYGSAAGFDPQP